MGDRTTSFEDCPKCGGKGTFECYEALSCEMKFDNCSECDYSIHYDFTEVDGVIEITSRPSENLAQAKTSPSSPPETQVIDSILAGYKENVLNIELHRGTEFEPTKDMAQEETLKETSQAIQSLISDTTTEAFRNGQLDCQKAGDPRNHAHFEEATTDEVIKELENLLPIHSDKRIGYMRNRIKELQNG